MSDLLDQLTIPSYVPKGIKEDLEQTLSYLWANYLWRREKEIYRNKAAFLQLSEEIHQKIVRLEQGSWEAIVPPNTDMAQAVRMSKNLVGK